MYSAIFLPKKQPQSTFRAMLKNFNTKNIKMKPPVAQFKKRSMKMYLFLKAKSQAKNLYFQHSCMLFPQEERRNENC